jgi:hypothetical protein
MLSTAKPGPLTDEERFVFETTGYLVITGVNNMDFDRYTMHIVYAPPWLIPSDRMENSKEFLAKTTPLRHALVGEWTRPEQPFGMGYEKPPFDGVRQ